MVINDLIPGVIQKLRGRDDMTSLIPLAARQAILDLTQNYEFEELKATGPLTNFVTGQQEYPLRGGDASGVQGNPFIYAADIKLTFISSWFIYYDTSGIVTPGVSTGMEITQRSIRVVEPMSKILGIPTVCCIHGDKATNGVIVVGFMPNNPYATQMRYQREHPFPPSNLNIGTTAYQTALTQQHIFMPADWQDIVEYATAEKLCYAPLGMMDVGMKYHQLLFGYKDKYGSDVPGLIQVRRSVQENMASFNVRAIKPVIRPYCRH